MTEKRPKSDCGHRTGDVQSRWERRTFLAIGGGVGATLFAGCTSESGPGNDPDDGDDGSDSPDGESNFRLLVSDRPADIDDFDSLEITFDSARVFQGGGDGEDDDDETEDDDDETEDGGTETAEDPAGDDDANDQGDPQVTDTPGEPGTEVDDGDDGSTEAETEEDDEDDGDEDEGDGDDGSPGAAGDEDDGDDPDDGESRGYVEFDLDGPTVDLTEVVGERAMAVTEGHLSEGSYQKLELHVSDVAGIVDGQEADVKVPSEKLQLTKPFEIVAGETVDFVFDINVVKRGNEERYNLKPVISKSGVVGQDVDEHEEVGENGEDDDDDESTETEEDETETEEDETETEEDETETEEDETETEEDETETEEDETETEENETESEAQTETPSD